MSWIEDGLLRIGAAVHAGQESVIPGGGITFVRGGTPGLDLIHEFLAEIHAQTPEEQEKFSMVISAALNVAHAFGGLAEAAMLMDFASKPQKGE